MDKAFAIAGYIAIGAEIWLLILLTFALSALLIKEIREDLHDR